MHEQASTQQVDGYNWKKFWAHNKQLRQRPSSNAGAAHFLDQTPGLLTNAGASIKRRGLDQTPGLRTNVGASIKRLRR